MAKINTANTDEMDKYKYGGLAGKFVGEKDLGSAKISLEKLAGDLGLWPGAQGFIEGAFASEDGIKKAVGTYSNRYQESRAKATVGELSNYYDKLIDDYLETKKTEAKTELNIYQNEKYGDIIQKVTQAQEKIKSNTGNFSQADKDAAKKVLDKYKKVLTIIETMQEITFDDLSTGVVKQGRQKELQDLFP